MSDKANKDGLVGGSLVSTSDHARILREKNKRQREAEVKSKAKAAK